MSRVMLTLTSMKHALLFNFKKKLLAEGSLLSLLSGIFNCGFPEKTSGSEESLFSSEVRNFLKSSWVIFRNVHFQVLSQTLELSKQDK